MDDFNSVHAILNGPANDPATPPEEASTCFTTADGHFFAVAVDPETALCSLQVYARRHPLTWDNPLSVFEKRLSDPEACFSACHALPIPLDTEALAADGWVKVGERISP